MNLFEYINSQYITCFSKNREIFFFTFFVLLCSFYGGTLFGILTKMFFKNKILIFSIPWLLELINVYYFEKTIKADNAKEKAQYLSIILLNALKRGFLLGIFVDAFRVGS
jgi:uncharacterized membrane protein YoaK (UPF0700 family)